MNIAIRPNKNGTADVLLDGRKVSGHPSVAAARAEVAKRRAGLRDFRLIVGRAQ